MNVLILITDKFGIICITVWDIIPETGINETVNDKL